MTLEETIKRYSDNAEYERTHGSLQGCLEFKQLAEWLKELKQLREQRGWIPVSERMPKNEQDVLIQYGNSIFVGYHKTDNTKYDPQFEDLDDTGWYDEHDEFIDSSYSITAWMPLPEPYKEESENQ